MTKKLLSLILSFSLILSCVSPVWAENPDSSLPTVSDSSEVSDSEPSPDASLFADASDAEIPLPDTSETDTANAEIPLPDTSETDTANAEIPLPDTSETDTANAEIPLPDTSENDTADADQSADSSLLQTAEASSSSETEVDTSTTTNKPADEPTNEPEPDTPPLPDGIQFIDSVYVVTLGESAPTNFSVLQEAIRLASLSKSTVRIAKKGTYPICKSNSSAESLKLYPNVTLDLNKSTLVRSGLTMTNLIVVCDENGSLTGTGYTMCHDVTIKNGTLKGTNGKKSSCNLVNIGHTSNLLLSHINFKTCRGDHLLELSGCRNVRVEYCTFSGYIATDASTKTGEALQLDLCYSGADVSWNGHYTGDQTACQDITITGCTFKDYPAGIGNHHTVKGTHNSGIVITNNVFQNTKASPFPKSNSYHHPAIRCYAFDNSTISGNTITGNYTAGIEINGGSVTVTDNTIGTSSDYFSHPAITETSNLAWIPGNSNRKARITEGVTGGSITGNRIYCSASLPAVTLYDSSNLSKISENTISATKHNAIHIEKSKVSDISKNKLKAKGGTAVFLYKSKIKTIVSNTMTSAKNYGIYLSTSAQVQTKISGNTISSCEKSGIYAVSSAVARVVQSNTITGCKQYGIGLLNKRYKVTVTKNTLKNNKKALYIKAKGTIQKK